MHSSHWRRHPAAGTWWRSGICLVIAHEPEPFGGIAFVSRANQAAAFERISRSTLSWRFSRRSRLSSSRSAVVRPPSPRPALRSDCATQFLIDCAVGSNSVPVPPANGRHAPVDHLATELGRVRQSCLGHRGLLEPKWSGVHETGSTSLSPLARLPARTLLRAQPDLSRSSETSPC